MVRANVLKVKKQYGDKVKKYLTSKGWLGYGTRLGKTQNYLLFPLTEDADTEDLIKKFCGKTNGGGTIESRSMEPVTRRPASFKEALKNVVSEELIEKLGRSFDVVGDIAVLEIPEGFEGLERSIAWTLKRTFPQIEVVVKKTGKTKGDYRIRTVEPLVGERTETIHKEHDLRYKVDLNKTYFSPRLGTERLRVAEQVKARENVLVLFAGVGPYALLIAKKRPRARIVGVEWNEDAVYYFKENIALNKMEGGGIKLIQKDAKVFLKDTKDKFDRIIMPLPEIAYQYLDGIFRVANKGCKVHLYMFVAEEELPKAAKDVVNEAAKQAGRKVKILKVIKAGQYAPGVYRIVVDFEVL